MKNYLIGLVLIVVLMSCFSFSQEVSIENNVMIFENPDPFTEEPHYVFLLGAKGQTLTKDYMGVSLATSCLDGELTGITISFSKYFGFRNKVPFEYRIDKNEIVKIEAPYDSSVKILDLEVILSMISTGTNLTVKASNTSGTKTDTAQYDLTYLVPTIEQYGCVLPQIKEAQ